MLWGLFGVVFFCLSAVVSELFFCLGPFGRGFGDFPNKNEGTELFSLGGDERVLSVEFFEATLVRFYSFKEVFPQSRFARFFFSPSLNISRQKPLEPVVQEGQVYSLTGCVAWNNYMAMGQNPVPPVTLKSLLKRW